MPKIRLTGNGSALAIVDVISSGAGQSALFKMDWGAEKNYIELVADYLKKKGFR